ncbi:hypothetical protein ZOSMA_88G00330 [Zostera marina]|uniref:Uncharacterized protein n=1 Tax=Zostera marina TaxID=29655 RepID=A0A0K9NKS2_ZOSMR|nr:hypothetical protein ZOSMA_88G00330 [Zostera marina]
MSSEFGSTLYFKYRVIRMNLDPLSEENPSLFIEICRGYFDNFTHTNHGLGATAA